jgi:hypothetical protein
MPAANENAEVWDRCEGCSKVLHLGDHVFEYSECRVCEECAPTWEEAKRGFEREVFEEPDNWRTFQARLNAHLANGGSMSDRCTEIWL